MMRFINFDITVAKDGGKFLIKSKYEQGGEKTEEQQQPPEQISPAFAQLLSYVAGQSNELGKEIAQTAGTILHRWLFPRSIFASFSKCVENASGQGKGVRLRLILEDESLRKLPWEYLYDSDEFNGFVALRRDSPLIRYTQASDIAPERFPRGSDAKLLLAYAVEPANVEAVKAATAELSRIETELTRQVTQKRLSIHNAGAVTFSKLQSELAAFRPDMLHLVAVSQSGNIPKMLFYSDNGQPDPKTADQMQVLLQGTARVVVLSAPATQDAPNDAGLILAEALNSAQIPAVVALHREMPPNVASHFAAKIYHFLSINRTLDEAMTEMRINIYGRDQAAWGIPAMFMRAKDGRLWHENSPDPVETAVSQLHKPFEHPKIPDPYAPLMNLNFHHQVRGFQALIDEWRIGGCLIRSLPQSTAEDGLKLLMKRLYDLIPQSGQGALIKKFDLQSMSINNGPVDIWRRLATELVESKRVTLQKPTGPLTSKDKEAVATALGSQLRHRHIIFIFEHVDEDTIGPLVTEFWEQLIKIVLDPFVPLALPKGDFFLMSFFLDDAGTVISQSGGKFIEILAEDESKAAEPAGGWQREHVGRSFALPAVKSFKVTDLDALASQVKPFFLNAARNEIIVRDSDGLEPDVVLEILVNTLEQAHTMTNVTFDAWLEKEFTANEG